MIKDVIGNPYLFEKGEASLFITVYPWQLFFWYEDMEYAHMLEQFKLAI